MSGALELYLDLRHRGVELHVHDGRLRYRGPTGTLTDRDRQQLREHRADLLALLERTCADCGQVLLVRETRSAGICLRCMEPHEYQATLRTIAHRYRRRRGREEAQAAD